MVLVLDADERVPPETAMAVSDIVAKKPEWVWPATVSSPRNWFQGFSAGLCLCLLCTYAMGPTAATLSCP